MYMVYAYIYISMYMTQRVQALCVFMSVLVSAVVETERHLGVLLELFFVEKQDGGYDKSVEVVCSCFRLWLRILIFKLNQAENELCHHPRRLSVCGYRLLVTTSARHEVEQELHHEHSFEVANRIEELWFIHAGLACPSVLVRTM